MASGDNGSMVGLLIVAHEPLATALRSVGLHTFPEKAEQLSALDVSAGQSAEAVEGAVRQAIDDLGASEVLVLVDACGATPCNGVQRVLAQPEGVAISLVSGVSVPMLWRALCYSALPLEELTAKALAGAVQGVLDLRPCA
jgi:PTS system mannose-specific IIA component